MNLKECEYFIAIAEEASISKAAERLYMAQSSLSQFLSNLETEMGTKLFVRTSRGVRTTEAGRILLSFSYETVSQLHTTQEQIQDISMMQRGNVIVGISSFRGSYLMPPVLNAFHLEHPGISVKIVEENSMQLEQLLMKGDIDIALLVIPTSDSRMEAEFLMKDEICIITGSGHPIMQYVKTGGRPGSQIPQYVDLNDAIRYEFYLSDYDTILGREARRIFSRSGMVPIASNEKLTALFAAALGASGQGLALTYYSSRHYFQNAQFISLGEEGSSIDLGIVMSPGRYHSKATLALADAFRAVLGVEEEHSFG